MPLLEAILRGGWESSDPQLPDPPSASARGKIVPVDENYAQGSSAQNHVGEQGSAGHEAGDGHWVTINHRHVFIQESSGDGHDQHAQTPSQQNQQKRKDIANIAKDYDHSTAWAFDKKKDDFPPGSNKCNKFVYDVTKEAGAKPIVIGKDGKPRPPLAGEWADPNTKIANWRVLKPGETPQPGDVAAYPLTHLPGHAPYTGHSGIVTSVDSDGTVHAIAAHDDVVGPDDSFQPPRPNYTPRVTYRRYTGN
jgi:hypothetical protein